MLATIGFIMIAVIIFMLIQEKITPAPIFIITPLIAALLAGFGLPEIAKFIQSGVGTTSNIAILFIFSIIYFSVMGDVGMFDPFVNFLVKKAGNNVVFVTVSTCLIAIISHLDGALASTLLITIPAMLPIYKRLNMRPVVLLVIIGAAMSIMNLLPWGGPTARVAAITKVDVNALWQTLIPVQITGIFIAIAFSAFMGIVEKRRGAGLEAADMDAVAEVTQVDPKVEALKRPKLVWFNTVLTLGVIYLLCFTKIPAYSAFMIGLAIALVVNYPKAADQSSRIKAHAANALSMASILLASGIFLGVLSGTKMMDAMAKAMIMVVPDFLGPYLHLIMGALAVPVGMMLGTDSFFFGLTPLAIGVGAKFGISAANMSNAMLIGKNYGVLTTPHAATTFLAVGLAGVELKELLKFCTPLLWILSIISLVVAIVLGVVTI